MKDKKTTYYIIDRIEGDYAVCEGDNGVLTTIPTSLLPPMVKEGTRIKKTSFGYVVASNTVLEKKIKSLMSDLFD